MRLDVPHPSEGALVDDEIAWRRELRILRVRVKQLEVELGSKQAPSIEVKRGEEHGYGCGHPCAVVVYDEQPLVECKVCGTELDAIAVLREYARHERNFCYTLEHLRKEKRDLSDEVEKLKRLRARLRAEARKLLPSPPVRQGTRKYHRDWAANVQLDRVLAREPKEP